MLLRTTGLHGVFLGEHHFDGLQIVKDDARLRRLVAAEWTIARLSAADLRSMDDVVRRMGHAAGVVPRLS